MDYRLKRLAQMVEPGTRLADIGTDHAYLPIWLVQKGVVDFAIASDIRQGPIDNAEANVQAAGLTDKISVRLGPGLSTVKKEDDIETVVIAGMGGDLIRSILEAAPLFPKLVLEPNIGEPGLRAWLSERGYRINQEELLFDKGHSYELIQAYLTAEQQILSERELLFGPEILKHKGPAFKEKWHRQLAYFEKLEQALLKAKQPDEARLADLRHKQALIKEELDD
jgi:tRNA (adenine22-N1)-methyltransferase